MNFKRRTTILGTQIFLNYEKNIDQNKSPAHLYDQNFLKHQNYYFHKYRLKSRFFWIFINFNYNNCDILIFHPYNASGLGCENAANLTQFLSFLIFLEKSPNKPKQIPKASK